MISICISTRKHDAELSEIRQNIVSNIGLPDKHYEVIWYNNDGESLSKVYNKMLNQAKNNIVVFVHDDVEITTPFWGVQLIKIHKNYYDYSMIGVAGCKDVPASGKWWNSNHKYGIVTHIEDGKEIVTEYSKSLLGNVEEVKLLDGVFLSINKKLFDGFDETFEGFHFYDVGTCLHTSYRKGVTTDISIIHHSLGGLNDQWFENRDIFLTKYKSEIGTYIQPKIIPFVANAETYDSKSVSVIIYFDNVEHQQLAQIIKNIYTSNYPEYNFEVHVLNNIGETLKIDRDVTIHNYIGEKNKVIFDLIKKMKTDYVMVWDGCLQPFGDVVFETMRYADPNKIVTARIHLFENSIRSQGLNLGTLDDGTYVLRLNKFTHGFNYDFEPIIDMVGSSSEFFIAPTKLLKEAKLPKSEIDNEIGLLTLGFAKKNIHTICVNTVGLKNHTKNIDKCELADDFKKDSQTIKKILK